VHVLGGVARTSIGIEVFDVDVTETDTDLAGVFGAGLDIGLGRSWAVRVQGAYGVHTGTVSSRDSDIRHTEWDPQVFVGFVYRTGHR
jgi:hypothetical protein